MRFSFYLENNSQVYQPLTTEVYWVYTWLTNHDPNFQTSHARLRKTWNSWTKWSKIQSPWGHGPTSFFLFTVFFFSTTLHFSAAMVLGMPSEELEKKLQQLLGSWPKGKWYILGVFFANKHVKNMAGHRQVGSFLAPRFEGKNKNTKNMSKSNTWMIMMIMTLSLLYCFKDETVIYMLYTTSISPPRFFSAQKNAQLQLQKINDSKDSKAIQVGSFPFPFHLYGVSVAFGGSFHGDLSMVSTSHFSAFHPQTNQLGWLVARWGRGIFAFVCEVLTTSM